MRISQDVLYKHLRQSVSDPYQGNAVNELVAIGSTTEYYPLKPSSISAYTEFGEVLSYGTDYLVNIVTGEVSVVSGGALSASSNLLISYTYDNLREQIYQAVCALGRHLQNIRNYCFHTIAGQVDYPAPPAFLSLISIDSNGGSCCGNTGVGYKSNGKGFLKLIDFSDCCGKTKCDCGGCLEFYVNAGRIHFNTEPVGGQEINICYAAGIELNEDGEYCDLAECHINLVLLQAQIQIMSSPAMASASNYSLTEYKQGDFSVKKQLNDKAGVGNYIKFLKDCLRDELEALKKPQFAQQCIDGWEEYCHGM